VTRSPSVPYVVPFAVFMGLLVLQSALPMPELADQCVRIAALTGTLVWIARPVIDLHVRHAAASVSIGILVFVIWVAPDLLAPGYRHHWLFENPLTGAARGTLSVVGRLDPVVLALRTLRAVVIVPIVEELFWRAWLMRWLISPNFLQVPLGAYSATPFCVVAILFASEHGSYWDVGLAAGIVYNWWMVRAKSLGDLILAHAVTNTCLSIYVIAAGKWEYWL
jgi:CAAX prenyl protease-like protein